MDYGEEREKKNSRNIGKKELISRKRNEKQVKTYDK